MSFQKPINLAQPSQKITEEYQSEKNSKIFSKDNVNTQQLQYINKFFQINVSLEKQIILKNQTTVRGTVQLMPLSKIQNIPITIHMTGWSSCVIDSQNKSAMDIDQKWRQVHIQNTVENMIYQKYQKQFNFNSSAFLQATQIDKNQQKFALQTFLQGEQTIYQLNQTTSQRLKYLQQKQTYKYPFFFMVPKNMPVSMNKQILKGVRMIVQYQINVSIQSQQFQQKNLLKKVFKIIPNQKQYPIQILSNEIQFKCFHKNGKLQEFVKQPSYLIKFCRCISQICKNLNSSAKQQFYYQKKKAFLKYDLYHCQLIVNVNKDNFLNIVVRVYLQPNDEQLKICKQKIGNSYLSKKKPILLEQKTSQSKLQGQSENQNGQIKADYAHVKMVGSIASIKEMTIFQRDIQLSRTNYDMAQGQIMVPIQKSYQSQSNQLFQIRFKMLVQVHFKFQHKFNDFEQQTQKKTYEIEVISQKVCEVPL